MNIQQNNLMRGLLYLCIGLLSVLTLLGAYTLYTLNFVEPELYVAVPDDEISDTSLTSQEGAEAQLEALRPADYKEPTKEEVEEQLKALTPKDYVPPTEEEVKAQLDTLKNQQ